MNSIDVAEGIRRLNDIATEEYGTTFALAADVDNRTLAMRRTARLAGIELKQPFSRSEAVDPEFTETKARRRWLFLDRFSSTEQNSRQALDSLKGDPSYELELRVFHELQRQGDLAVRNKTFSQFLEDQHNESNWFLMLLVAAKPYLCENSEKQPAEKAEKPDSAARKQLWDLVRDAADQGLDAALEASLLAVGTALVKLVPFLALAPFTIKVGLSFFLIHYAKKGYCNAEIETEIITTLRLSGSYERD